MLLYCTNALQYIVYVLKMNVSLGKMSYFLPRSPSYRDVMIIKINNVCSEKCPANYVRYSHDLISSARGCLKNTNYQSARL